MSESQQPQPRSRLLDLLVSPAQKVMRAPDALPGLADEREPFPFLAIVGQREMKLALLLSVINPLVGGVLLLGPRGTAKTTAVRALIDLLPHVERSLCPSGAGCTESMVQEGGMAAICPECARKVGYGEPLSRPEQVRIVELPLNARYEDVVGGVDERAALERQRVRLERGILAAADENILYIDEVNLLSDAILDAILDAAAQGYFTVRRGPLKLSYWARFRLIGSMNPEEGALRPQIMDRFGLRVVLHGLQDPDERYLAYERAVQHRRDPAALAAAFAGATLEAATEVEAACARLPQVSVSPEAQQMGLSLVQAMGIASNRADITLLEAARAYAAMDDRTEATPADIAEVAPLALRLRENPGLATFMEQVAAEEERLARHLAHLHESPKTTPAAEEKSE